MERVFLIVFLTMLFGAESAMPAHETIALRSSSTQNVFAAPSAKTVASRAQSIEADPCKLAYWACMDAFCMPSNSNGGRCSCSNDSIKLDKEYAAALGVEIEPIPTDCAEGDISCKVGAEKYSMAVKLCESKLGSDCKANFSFTKLQYSQNIRNDCAAYQVAIKDIKEKSDAFAAAAKKEALSSALAEFETANKYNESECLTEFKKCMNTPEVCGANWSRCKVSGISEKRYLCEKILDSCDAVRESVWEGFVMEITPTLKSAELNADDAARQNCLARISDCITKACSDNITGLGETMDSCLSRPEMVQNFCKIELDECDKNGELWTFVKQKLAAMRTDRCTIEVKDCFASENTCGPKFSGCIGIDTDTIIKICPLEKLIVCKQDNPKFSAEDIKQIIDGIFLSMDNELLTLCIDIRDAKMIEVCGSLSNCDKQIINNDAAVNAVIAMIETDPKVSWCIGGRDMSEISKTVGKTAARFPNLTIAIQSIIKASKKFAL